MSLQPQYETYRYTDEIITIPSQSIVECRLSGSEIGAILAVQAKAVPAECVCADGEVRYSGKLLLCIVYEDSERKICRVERGAEFYHKAENSLVTPACFAKTAYHIDNVTHRREGSGLYVSVILGATSRVYGGKQAEYLVGGEGVYVKTQPATLYKTVCVSGETEGEDEFETENVGDVLLHSETPLVTSCRAHAGQIEIEGELNLGVCVLKADDSVCSYERLIAFSMQIPCEEAFDATAVAANVCVKSATLSAGVDEEKGKSKMVLSYALSADCILTTKEELTVASDAFAPTCQLGLEKANAGGRYLTKQLKYVERIGGVALFSPQIEGDYALESAVLPRASAVCKKTEHGFEAEGVMTAEILLRNADTGCKRTTLELPFVFPIPVEGAYAEAEFMVCGLNVRRQNGEVQAEATLKMSLRVYDEEEISYVCAVTEGAKIPKNDAAVSIVIPRKGEDLWTLAKRLGRAPEEVQSSNPTLQFPVKEGERIIIYRQIK